MTRIVRIVACIILIFGSCKTEIHENSSLRGREFHDLLFQYYEDGLKLNPLQATSIGDNRYNDQFLNPLDNENIRKLKAHFSKYKQAIAEYSDESLSESARFSKSILNWECDINLAGLEFNKPRYMPCLLYTSDAADE